MKNIAYIGLIIAISLSGYVFLKPPAENVKITGLPWQIEITNSSSRVFDIELEHSTLAEVTYKLGTDHELAIISSQDVDAALEVYYSHFKSGPLKGKLILGFELDNETLIAMQERADNSKFMASGARQFFLNASDLQAVQQQPVNIISFIPAANLSREVIIQRFGQPTEIIDETEETQHLLYRDLGLDIILNTESKELFQYVSPRAFNQLVEPLRQLQFQLQSQPQHQPQEK
jgi:hypothetical protein